MAVPYDFRRAAYRSNSIGRRASGKTSTPSWEPGMSIFRRTDFPSKKSLRSASDCAMAGAASPRTRTRDAAWRVRSMRQTIPSGPYLDQWFVEPRALAFRALRGTGHLVFGEDVATAPAARGFDADVLVGGLGRLEEVLEVIFDLFARELQLVRD